ncbi:DUF262 domain-containing protein [Paraburkholderia phenazinium]|uniref:GmrSD restriction endonucleases N-terminal domain-containing protein n=1 Tax=Paraburkholderia phenazinium TaxID=60549 RepID=A0A1N6HSI9_9BURK|nr:DUF262 domain-containing protein [Paraburkholderia phenazinium]SIO22723.1 Protein of unknown function DUF262 [Paraburkholderia phenazinium]
MAAPANTSQKEIEITRIFNAAQDRLVLQASDMSLETVAAMVEKGAIDTQPSYQRRERWSPKRQSALIESFLLNIPIPPVYLAEEAYGKYTVIDGKQRLSTITRFMRNKFSLGELEKFTALTGFTFEKLPTEPRNALEIRPYVRVITLLKQSDPDLKYEVFERLNTGGEALYAQEIRNAAFRGKLNDLLFELSTSNFLRQQLKISKNNEPAYLQMQDVEYVLRFITMRDSWTNFSGDYRRSMDKFMEKNRDPSPVQLGAIRKVFLDALTRCEVFWGADAFKRYDGASARNQFLAGMYDAQMVGVSLLSAAKVKKLTLRVPQIRRATRKLFEGGQFEGWVRSGTNTRSSVEGRIGAIKNMLDSIA